MGAMRFSWLFFLVLTGSSSEETNQSQAGQGNAEAVQRLRIKADDTLPRFSDAKQTLFKAGATQPSFACDGTDDSLAEEPPKIGFRRLQLSIDEASSSSMSSMLGGLLGDAEESAGPSQLFLIEAKVVVISSNDAMPLLSAALDRSESDGPLEIFEGDQLDDEVTILYDCWQQGTARVELRFLLASEPEGQPGTEICMAWRKRCGSFAFDALEVRNGQSLIYPAPKEGAQQPALLSPEGTYEEVTKLQLSSSGAMRLKVPKVTSEEQLKVEIRGLATDALEVTATDEVEISIVYSCLSAGVIGVELALEQAVLSAAHAPEVLHLHWRKHCGDSVYRYLDVFLKENNNRTQVVSKGRTLPGFVHCPKQAAEPGAVDGTKPIIKTECSADPAVEIGPKDLKTSIELRVDPEGNPVLPSLQPQPDLSFDRKILRAYIMQPGMETFRPQKSMSSPSLSRASSTNMVVRYTCHRAGVSSIVVTIYVMQHKPIDFAWRKRCSEPKIHTSKALTAPQAMTFAFLVCGGIGMVVCMVCLFCSSDQDKNQLFQGPVTKKTGRGPARSPDRRDNREIEFWHVGPDSQKVGYEYEEEIVYHPGRS
mmetsp:Transcript_68136/g.149689  ORF Transcript_68136/g.149689 Transcript_68136/m.149689 type:complete len:594 (+) Transcript_68136:42-1823(+)